MPDELPNYATTTPARRRGGLFHQELLEPIHLPPMREPQVIISMDEYRSYERFLDVFISIENAIARGRLEARIEAYEMVLRQVELNDTLSAVRQPALLESLRRIIAACREDLARIEIAVDQRVAVPAGADLHEGRPAEQVIPVGAPGTQVMDHGLRG
jgi:hypothetical protein